MNSRRQFLAATAAAGFFPLLREQHFVSTGVSFRSKLGYGEKSNRRARREPSRHNEESPECMQRL